MKEFDIKNFLSLFLKESEYKSIIFLLDKYKILEKSIHILEDDLELSKNQNPFGIFNVSELQESIELIKTTDFTTKSLIITMSESNILSKIREYIINNIGVDFIEKTLYFQNVFTILSNGKYPDVSIWDLKLRHFTVYTTDVAPFLIKNYSEYDRIFKNEVNEVKDEFLLYFLFCDLPKFEQAKSLKERNTIKRFYFIEKFLTSKNAKLIEDLTKAKAPLLFRVLKEQIRRLFKPAVSVFFLYLIENGKTELLINLCIVFKIFKEIDKNPNLNQFKIFKDDISPFLDEVDFNLKKEGELLFNDEFFNEFIELISDFFDYIIISGKIKNLKKLFSKFKSAEIILEIEKEKDFFKNELDVDDTKMKEIFDLTQCTFLYSGIVKFNYIIFQKLFDITENNLNRKAKRISLIAQYRYFISEFKNNIYYKVKLGEYILQYKFLKNIIKLFIINKDLDAIKDESIKMYQLTEWKKFYTDLILPNDTLCWSTFENSRLFWSYKELPKFMLLLSENIVKKIREINLIFLTFLMDNYPTWVKNKRTNAPISVVNVIKKFFKPNNIEYQNDKVDYFLFIIIDCCRVDIWDNLRHLILNDFPVLGSNTITGLSILPTETKFARRALVTGDYPSKQKFFTSSNEGKDIFTFFKDNFTFAFSKIKRLDKEKKEDILKFYTVNCELLDNNNNVIENLSNEFNFQFCVFNFPDIISHNFEISLNYKILEIIYEEKIKPIIRKVLEIKSNPVIFFGTDHGIVKCRDKIDWKFTTFDNHWFNKDDYISRKNRYFVSKKNILKNYRDDKLIKIENNFEKWGLASQVKEPHIKNSIDIKGYYFGIAYDDLLGSYGENTKKYAHGGASFFEFFIPFSILSKNLLNPISPIHPKITLIEENENIGVNIKNPNANGIKVLIFDFYISHYHYLFQNLTIKGKSKINLNLNLRKLIEPDYRFKIKYEFNERVYFFKI